MQLKNYIIGLGIFAILLAGTYALAVHQLATGYVDKYYPKFTQPAGSMIVGLSRAQYGLVPSVFSTAFPNADRPFVNFAFELYQSPYGEVLFEDLQHKLKPDVDQGIFVLEVSPAGFLMPSTLPESEIGRIDGATILGKMTEMGAQPNYEYIRNCFGGSLYKGFFRMKPFGNITVHQDGWVAFADQYDFYTVTTAMTQEWKEQTLATYQKVIAQQKRSASRIASFIKIIKLLKQHGKVYLVRMPASDEVITFENTYWRTFDQEILAIAKQEQVPFFNHSLSNETYRFYDGSHFFDESARQYTQQLCEEIAKGDQN